MLRAPQRKEFVMPNLHPKTLLRAALLGDAVASGATGALMLVGAGALTSLFGLPEGLLRWAGTVLLPYAALVAYVGTRERLSRAAIWAVIAANAAWAVESAMLLLSGWVSPTTLGAAFVVFQAAVVAGFAIAQYAGLRGSAAAALPRTAQAAV
jgi:hypothetical protein